MINCSNYLNHVVISPAYYQRNFKHDLPTEEKNGICAYGQRIVMIALPFLSLYKPLGNCISIAMGSSRGITHLWTAATAKNISQCAEQVFQITFAMFALAAATLNFTLGLAITTLIDLVTSSISFIRHFIRGEFSKAWEEFFQILSSVFYLAVLFSGNLEVILLSLLFQTIFSFYQARNEIKEGRYPECIAKILMGLIRCYQVKGTYDQIQRRNFLYSLSQLEHFRIRTGKGRNVRHLVNSSLNNLEAIQENKVVLTDAEGKEYDFGSHTHGYGKGLVKPQLATYSC